VNSAFIGTDLEARLRAADIKALVICGATTKPCVKTTPGRPRFDRPGADSTGVAGSTSTHSG